MNSDEDDDPLGEEFAASAAIAADNQLQQQQLSNEVLPPPAQQQAQSDEADENLRFGLLDLPCGVLNSFVLLPREMAEEVNLLPSFQMFQDAAEQIGAHARRLQFVLEGNTKMARERQFRDALYAERVRAHTAYMVRACADPALQTRSVVWHMEPRPLQ